MLDCYSKIPFLIVLLIDCVKIKLLDRSPLMNDDRQTAFLIRQPGRKEQIRPLTCTTGWFSRPEQKQKRGARCVASIWHKHCCR